MVNIEDLVKMNQPDKYTQKKKGYDDVRLEDDDDDAKSGAKGSKEAVECQPKMAVKTGGSGQEKVAQSKSKSKTATSEEHDAAPAPAPATTTTKTSLKKEPPVLAATTTRTNPAEPKGDKRREKTTSCCTIL